MAEQKIDNPGTDNPDDDSQDITLDELLNGDSNLQSQFDKKMQAAMAKNLEKEKAKWLAEAKAEKEEAEKLAAMTEKERNDALMKKLEDEKNSAMSELAAFKLREEAVKIAREKGLDSTFLDYFDFAHETAESIKTKIDNISGFVTKKIEDGVNEKLKQDDPVEKKDSTPATKLFVNASY